MLNTSFPPLPSGSGPDRGRGRQALRKAGIPPLWKRGLGEIFGRICLLYYGLLSKSGLPNPSHLLKIHKRRCRSF
jgi:hypothetical protein